MAIICQRCNGAGMISDLLGGMSPSFKCDTCGGTGKISNVVQASDESEVPNAQVGSPLVRGSFNIYIPQRSDFTVAVKAGQYDFVNDGIWNFERLIPPTIRNFDLALLHVGGQSIKQVELELSIRGLYAATIWQLLAFGAAYPSMQRKFPIIALGSHCTYKHQNRKSHCFSPYLDYRHGDRQLDLTWTDSDVICSDDARFLAIV